MIKFDNNFLIKNKYGRRYQNIKGSNWLMLTIADADCKSPKPILDKIKQVANNGYFIYLDEKLKLQKAIEQWYKKRHNISIKHGNLLFTNGVVQAIGICIRAFSNKNDGVIISTPAYPIFIESFNEQVFERKQVINRLKYDYEINNYVIDWQLLEKQFKDENNKIYILCSPHNPLGRVWTKGELSRIAKLALKYNVKVISDEIWADLTFSKTTFHSFLNSCPEAKKCGIVCSSSLKTFNMGGMQFGYLYYEDNQIGQKIKKLYDSYFFHNSTRPILLPALVEAYTNPKCFNWSKEFNKNIEQNYQYIYHELTTKTKINCLSINSCFVVDLDFSNCVKSEKELETRINKIKIDATLGSHETSDDKDPQTKLLLRINFAISKENIIELVKRLIKEFK